jgi:hypothetical protein
MGKQSDHDQIIPEWCYGQEVDIHFRCAISMAVVQQAAFAEGLIREYCGRLSDDERHGLMPLLHPSSC